MNRAAIAISIFIVSVVLLAYLWFVGLSGGKPSFTATDITGASIGTAPWALPDAQGKSINVASSAGKVTVVFFGFTRCPEVCPTTLVDYAAVMKALGKEANKVQVLFATLDPERDAFPSLQAYTQAFHPSFVALRGDLAATKQAADSFKVFFAKSGGTTGADGKLDNYTIDHTAASYVFDAKGNIRLFVRNGQAVDSLIKDIKQLLP